MQNFATSPQTQDKALQKALQSPRIGKHGKRKETLALEKALEKKAERIVEDMLVERSRMINLMKAKMANASLRDLIYGIDLLTKNILLLSGNNTGKVGMGALLDQLEKDENPVTFSWKS